jgi:hypothetical protein
MYISVMHLFIKYVISTVPTVKDNCLYLLLLAIYGVNMVGKYKALQAILLEPNSNRIFSSCGNHTLNLVRDDSVESYMKAILHFGRIR